jgi:hypothetical protein
MMAFNENIFSPPLAKGEGGILRTNVAVRDL